MTDAEDICLCPDEFEPNWQLIDEVRISGPDVAPFASRLGAKVTFILNQIFLIEGDGRLQVNYVECADENEAAAAHDAMRRLVGSVNLITQIGRVLIEIIGPDMDVKERVLSKLRRSEKLL